MMASTVVADVVSDEKAKSALRELVAKVKALKPRRVDVDGRALFWKHAHNPHCPSS